MSLYFDPEFIPEPIPKLIGLSYEKYLKKRHKGSHFGEALEKYEKEKKLDAKNINDLYDRIQYLLDTVTDYRTMKTEIIHVCDLFLEEINTIENFNVVYLTNQSANLIISMIGLAEFTNEEKSKFDSAIHFAILHRLKEMLAKGGSFTNAVSQVNFWFNIHKEYLSHLKLGFPISDLLFLSDIPKYYPEEYENLKNHSREAFTNFADTFKWYFKWADLSYKKRFSHFYLDLCLEQIIVSRNYGLYNKYYEQLEDYYSVKYEKKPAINWMFKNFVGYGEKPWLLLYIFFVTNFLFAFIFTIGKFNFKGISTEPLQKFVDFVYFNNTSMLTVGYGDIAPDSIPAKIGVIVLQILGFIISGSAIALLLKRILRF